MKGDYAHRRLPAGRRHSRGLRAHVAEIDRLGYDALWLTDSSLHSRNCWAYLTLAARASARLQLGTAVTNPVTRHPAVTAVAAATIAEISGGRFTLGIGAGDRPLLSLAEKPARLADLEKSIEVIRALWAGAARHRRRAAGLALDDAHYRFAPVPDIPVWVSATGPKTLELAGRVADGVILLAGLHPDGIKFALEHIDRGAAQAGRDRPEVTVFAYGAIDDDDVTAAFAAARTIAAWFPQTSPVYCEIAGLPADLVEQVRQQLLRRRVPGGGPGGRSPAGRLRAPDGAGRRLRRGAPAHPHPGRARHRLHDRLPARAGRMHTIERFSACVAAEQRSPGVMSMLVIDNGTVLTMDDARSVHFGGHVVIDGDRITAVGAGLVSGRGAGRGRGDRRHRDGRPARPDRPALPHRDRQGLQRSPAAVGVPGHLLVPADPQPGRRGGLLGGRGQLPGVDQVRRDHGQRHVPAAARPGPGRGRHRDPGGAVQRRRAGRAQPRHPARQ